MNRKQRRAQGSAKVVSADAAAIDERLREAARLREDRQYRDAVDIYQSILQDAPDHPQTLREFGVTAIVAGQSALAVDLLQRAIASSGPDGAAYLSDLGYALAAAERFDEALDIFRQAVDARPKDPDAHFNMGNVLNALERHEEASAAFRDTVSLAPDMAAGHANLGGVLHLMQDYDGAAAAYRRALEIMPDSPDLHHNLGAVYRGLGDLEAAADSYGHAVVLAPERPEFQEKLGASLLSLGQVEAAIPALRAAVSRAPDFVDARAGLAEALIGTGAPADAITECDEYLDTFGYNSGVIACKAIALNETGDTDGARYFLDLDRFLAAGMVTLPPGYADDAAFRASIETEARAHPSLAFEPPAVATKSGFQTTNLFDAPTPAVIALQSVVNAAVQEYIDALPDDPGHPFIANAPARWSLNGWTVILQSQGHQRAHIHPSGWLSGVFYVKVPSSIGSDSQEGWIEFGRPPETILFRHAMETRLIEPREGAMLLFPSYLYHRTIPFNGDEERISFAFDIVAQD